MTQAERHKKCREKKKQTDKYEQYLKADRERKAAKKLTLSDTDKSIIKANNTLSQRRSRMKKRKAKAPETTGTSESSENDQQQIQFSPPCAMFSSKQSLGKAKRKVARALPLSPRKKVAIIALFSTEYSEMMKVHVKPNKVHGLKLATETEEMVHKFYNDNEVSWQAPGMKDFIIKYDADGEKKRVQKKYLLMTLREAYELFRKQHPDVYIGKSKFSELRPVHILPQRYTPENVCVCKIHENVRLLLKALHTVSPEYKTSFREFISQVVCDQDNFKCMFGKCDACPGLSTLKPEGDECGEMISWQAWGEEVVKETVQGTFQDAYEQLESNLSAFLMHTYIKRAQASYFTEKINNPDNGEVIVQMDFSENYECVDQNSIQSQHWKKTQITVYTAVAWYKDINGVKNCESYAFISDYKQHDKYFVHAACTKIISEVKKLIDFDRIVFFSDGAASQFKQKYTLSNATYILNRGIAVEWNFFATSHGKGAVDGMGVQVKREATLAALSRKRVHYVAEFTNVHLS